MSTDGSDEEFSRPSPTLSFGIAQFDLFWPDYENLAMNPRLIGLINGLTATAGPKVVGRMALF